MKKVLILILLSLSFFNISYARTNKEIFDNGIRAFKENNYQEAIEQFSELITREPKNADAYKNRGVSYMKLEKFDLAIQDFEKAKTIFPELRGLYSNLGVAWYYKKDYDKAIENYNMEIQVTPENSLAFFNRALCYAELNQHSRALDDLDRTLAIEPDFYWAICYKGDLLALQGENLKAIEQYESAVEKYPDNDYAVEKLKVLQERVKGNESPQEALSARKTEKIKKKDIQKRAAWTLQVGAYLNESNALKMEKKMQDKGLDSRILKLTDKKNRTWHLVRSGSFSDKAEAGKAAAVLKEQTGVKPVIRPSEDW